MCRANTGVGNCILLLEFVTRLYFVRFASCNTGISSYFVTLAHLTHIIMI